MRVWLASPLFARQLRDFLLVWAVMKAANAFTAESAGLPPLGFRPTTEAAAFADRLFAIERGRPRPVISRPRAANHDPTSPLCHSQ